ncbi:MAG: hypothetical protein JWO25_3306 [Alphaproteobacteria bacterium]|nr:hypothetical protein [Alphaproteobacteria bacterium]
MADEVEVLSYRELADRLGISPDAARNRANRKARTGAWRIVPGNHPSERVRVEVPAADLVRAQPVSRPIRIRRVSPAINQAGSAPGQAAASEALDRANARMERMTSLLLECQTVLVQAQRRLDEKDVLLAVARQQREKIRADAAERIIQAKTQIIRIQEMHKLDAMELRAAERRELGTKAELDRALSDVASLSRLVERFRRRPWWSRLLG